MLREEGPSRISKAYDLEESSAPSGVVGGQLFYHTQPIANSAPFVISAGQDSETETLVSQLEAVFLSPNKDFSEKRKHLGLLVRRAFDLRATKQLKRYLFYFLLRELQNSHDRMEKAYCLSLLKEANQKIKIEGEFRTAFVQSLILLFEIEKIFDIAVTLLEVIALLCKDCPFDNEARYEVIATMHSRLYHSDFRIKKYALAVIVSLTKSYENEFIVVCESVYDRCLETDDKDLVLAFLQTMAEVEFLMFHNKVSKLVIEMISKPIFSFNKDSLTHLIKFLERIVMSFSSIGSELSSTIFIYLCKNMRNLHKEIRKQAIDVFCKMDLRQINQDLLNSCLQKEKFEDYQTKKKASPLSSLGPGFAGQKKIRTVESYTEKTLNQMEMKSNSENFIIGSIHHVLEDELPEIRIAAIKALETLGKILSVEKNQEIKELLLYFLNDDFDKVRIKALNSLYVLYSDITLSDFELDTIHFNVKENLYELRIAIYKLLSNFTPKKALQEVRILQRLSENIRLYREDAPWIYKTIKKIFEKNRKFHQEVLNEMLFNDSPSLIQEKDIKDPDNIIRIILLSSGLKFTPSLGERYPHYFRKHVILMKELYPGLIYDPEAEDAAGGMQSLRSNILGEDTLKTFLKSLNEQLRGKDNLRVSKSLSSSFEKGPSKLEYRPLELFWLCDKLLKRVKLCKQEIGWTNPSKEEVLDILFQIGYIRQALRISPNLKRFFTLIEAFFWVQYLILMVKKAQLRREIDSVKAQNTFGALQEACLLLSKEDATNQLQKLAGVLHPILSSMSHTTLLQNTSLVTILSNYSAEFNMEQFSFFQEDFTQVTEEKAFLHSREREDDVIRVVPRYPFNIKLYIEAETQTANQAFIVLKEFDEATSLVQFNTKNSITTNEDKLAKILVDLDYDVRKRIDGLLELKISMMKFLSFKVLGVSKLRGWLDLFRPARLRLPSFPFLPVSNEIVLQLKTKY